MNIVAVCNWLWNVVSYFSFIGEKAVEHILIYALKKVIIKCDLILIQGTLTGTQRSKNYRGDQKIQNYWNNKDIKKSQSIKVPVGKKEIINSPLWCPWLLHPFFLFLLLPLDAWQPTFASHYQTRAQVYQAAAVNHSPLPTTHKEQAIYDGSDCLSPRHDTLPAPQDMCFIPGDGFRTSDFPWWKKNYSLLKRTCHSR